MKTSGFCSLSATLGETYSCGDSFRFERNSLLSRRNLPWNKHEAPKTVAKVVRSGEGGVRKGDLFFVKRREDYFLGGVFKFNGGKTWLSNLDLFTGNW